MKRDLDVQEEKTVKVGINKSRAARRVSSECFDVSDPG